MTSRGPNHRTATKAASLALVGLLWAIWGAGTADAECMVKITKCAEAGRTGLAGASGAKTIRIPQPPPPVAIGDTLPQDYMVLMNAGYFGLPPVSDGWRYYRVKRDIYRVDAASRQVLERVTQQANRAFQ